MGRRSPSSALRTTSFGTPSPPGRPLPAPPRTPSSAPARRRPRRGRRSCRSRTWPRNGVICALHRAAAVGVLADHLPGASDARRRDREGPVLRIAQHRGGRALGHRAARAATPVPPARRRGGSRGRCAARSGRPTRPGSRPIAASRWCRPPPATTCALVTTRPGAGDPSGALDARARRRCRGPSPRCRPPAARRDRWAIAALGRSDVRVRAPDGGRGIDVPQHVEQRPRGRQDVVQRVRIREL